MHLRCSYSNLNLQHYQISVSVRLLCKCKKTRLQYSDIFKKHYFLIKNIQIGTTWQLDVRDVHEDVINYKGMFYKVFYMVHMFSWLLSRLRKTSFPYSTLLSKHNKYQFYTFNVASDPPLAYHTNTMLFCCSQRHKIITSS